MADLIEHFEWCNPTLCAIAHVDSRHLGEVYRIDAALLGDVGIEVQLVANGDDPVAVAPVTLDVRLSRSLELSVEGYTLTAEAVRKLHAILSRLISAFPAHA